MGDLENERRDLVQAALLDGDELLALVRPWGRAAAEAIIERVTADYVVQLELALRGHAPPGVSIDAGRFMARYDALWQAKLGLLKYADATP